MSGDDRCLSCKVELSWTQPSSLPTTTSHKGFPLGYSCEMVANGNFVISGQRRRCSSTWHDGRTPGTCKHPTPLFKEVQELASFDSFYLHTSPWTAGSCFAKQFSRLRSQIHLESVFFEVVISSEDYCVLFCFISELPGLFIRTINHFLLDLQFFAYAAATL